MVELQTLSTNSHSKTATPLVSLWIYGIIKIGCCAPSRKLPNYHLLAHSVVGCSRTVGLDVVFAVVVVAAGAAVVAAAADVVVAVVGAVVVATL